MPDPSSTRIAAIKTEHRVLMTSRSFERDFRVAPIAKEIVLICR
jgi:hypothetical protein